MGLFELLQVLVATRWVTLTAHPLFRFELIDGLWQVVAQSSELLRMKAFPRPAAIKQREPDLEKAPLLAQH